MFPGVPLDPPSTSWTRTIRITNIRVNAQAFAPATLLSTISAVIQFQGPASVSVNQISATIAYVQPGMGATKTTVDNSFLQCEYPTDTLAKGDEPATESHGWDTCTASGTEYPGISTSICSGFQYPGFESTYPYVWINTLSSNPGPHPVISITEGYQSSWKSKNMAQLLGNGGGATVLGGAPNYGAPVVGTGGNSAATNYAAYDGYASFAAATTLYPADISMNNPAVRFFTESGFVETGTANLRLHVLVDPTAIRSCQSPTWASRI